MASILSNRTHVKGINKLPRPIKEVLQGTDGHIYYVIESERENIFMGIQFVEYYADLTNFTGMPGLFFVRNAAGVKTVTINGEVIGQHGDPTVHEGWAMYCWDNQKKMDDGTIKAGWRKVAEQESVDGPWGIDERILKMLVRRTEFNEYVDSHHVEYTNLKNIVENNVRRLNGLDETVNDLLTAKHTHGNKELLDTMEFKFGQFYVNGHVVSGNTFFYDYIIFNEDIKSALAAIEDLDTIGDGDYDIEEIKRRLDAMLASLQNLYNGTDGAIYWKDPTKDELPVPVNNSYEIAEKFAKISIVKPGMILSIMEVNGDVTTYTFRRVVDHESEGDISYEPVLMSTTFETSRCITYVDILPLEEKAYENRGFWCPLLDDGEHYPNKFYRCVKVVDPEPGYKWVSLDDLLDKSKPLDNPGATLVSVFSSDDPRVPYKSNTIMWKRPSMTPFALPFTDVVLSYSHTTLVRKYGSEPTGPTDGEIIFTDYGTTDETQTFVDKCAYDVGEVYYRAFSFTKLGHQYGYTDAMVNDRLNWKTIKSLIAADKIKDVISVGDTVVLPKHPTLGDIACTVTGFSDEGEIILESNEALACLKFSETESWLHDVINGYSNFMISNDGIVQDGKSYYYYDDGFKELAMEVGSELPEGLTVYEPNPDYPNGVFNFCTFIPEAEIEHSVDPEEDKKKFLKTNQYVDWWTREGHSACLSTVDADTELGVVVRFYIDHT